MKRKLARVRVSTTLILTALAFPDDANIIACFGDRAGYPGEVDFIVESDDLPVLDEGQEAPLLIPVISVVGPNPGTWLAFDWNFPDGD